MKRRELDEPQTPFDFRKREPPDDEGGSMPSNPTGTKTMTKATGENTDDD